MSLLHSSWEGFYSQILNLGERPPLRKTGQDQNVFFRHRFNIASHLNPGLESTANHVSVKTFFPEKVHQPGACRLVPSSTVEINLFVSRQLLQFFLNGRRLQADRTFNPGRPFLVISMTARVRHHYDF